MTSGKDLLSVVLRVRLGVGRSNATERASVEPQSVVLRSRYDVLSASGSNTNHSEGQGHHPGGNRAAGATTINQSNVRPLGRVRLARAKDSKEVSLSLPKLRRSYDNVSDASEKATLHYSGRQPRQQTRQSVDRQRSGDHQVIKGTQEDQQVTNSSHGQAYGPAGGGQQHSKSVANMARSNKGGGQMVQSSPVNTETSDRRLQSSPREPQTKTTTTMFINQNQCMYIAHSVPVSHSGGTTPQPYTTQSSNNGSPTDSLLRRKEGGVNTHSGVNSSCASQRIEGGLNTGRWTTQSTTCKNISSQGSFQLPRVTSYSTSQSLDSGSSPGSSALPTSSQSTRSSTGASRENSFAKKLKLVTNRTRSVTKGTTQGHSEGDANMKQPDENGSNTQGRRSINLPMRIKVHLPTAGAPTSNVTRERLLVEKARRDIRDILRDGATCPESNRSAYTVSNEAFGATSQAKLTPVLIPPGIPDTYLPGLYTTSPGDSEGCNSIDTVSYSTKPVYGREVTWAGQDTEASMFTQHYPSHSGSNTSPDDQHDSSSSALISTHRIPFAQRAQTAKPLSKQSVPRVARITATIKSNGQVRNSRYASPTGYDSRPTSAYSTYGMPRSCSSSISDNPPSLAPSETELADFSKQEHVKSDGKPAMWPSLIDVQRLKIGGFRYKNKPGNNNQEPLPADSGHNSFQQIHEHGHLEEHPDSTTRQESIESQTKKIVNLGTIIVPSHTCVDCPLCNLYYAKEDLWHEGGGHNHDHYSIKNTNTNNSNNKSVNVRKRGKSTKASRELNNEQWSEVDLSKAVAHMDREFDAPIAPRASPDIQRMSPRAGSLPSQTSPEPEIRSPTLDTASRLSENSLSNQPAESEHKPKEDACITFEKDPLLQTVQPKSTALPESTQQNQQSKGNLLHHRRGVQSANVLRTLVRNPFNNFRNEGVSVTVRMRSGHNSGFNQKQNYEKLLNKINKSPVTFKFSYVKVNNSDLLLQHLSTTKPD